MTYLWTWTSPLSLPGLCCLQQQREALDQDSTTPSRRSICVKQYRIPCSWIRRRPGPSQKTLNWMIVKHAHIIRSSRNFSFLPANLETIPRGTDVSHKIIVYKKKQKQKNYQYPLSASEPSSSYYSHSCLVFGRGNFSFNC